MNTFTFRNVINFPQVALRLVGGRYTVFSHVMTEPRVVSEYRSTNVMP